MAIWLHILLWILLGLSLGLAGYWWVVVAHVAKTVRVVPELRRGLELPRPERLPPLCVIVPAHNEERGIAHLCDALRAQDYPDFRVVWALDRCTDRTLDIVRERTGDDDRFRVVEIGSCPDDWVGKVHAIYEGYSRAPHARDAELVLFLDADTIPEPACLRAAVTLLLERKLQMLSVMSQLTTDEWFEKVVQPAAFLELLRQYPLARANSREKRRPFANGQFILATRAAYDSIGGHEAVKSEVLEDVHLARRLVAAGHDTGLVLAGDLLLCRMYNTWAAFRRGWLRIFGECANRKPGRLREAAWRLRLTGSLLPIGGMLGLPAGIIACIALGGWFAAALTFLAVSGLTAYFGVVGYAARKSRIPLVYTPTFAIGSWIAAGIMLQAARDLDRGSPTHWGGKKYKRDVR
jgi:hypothetical protein